MGISIKTRNLSKTLIMDGQDLHILSDLDIAVAEGEFAAVWGPSGCGKTTLLGLMAGLDLPSGGQILLGGLDIGSLKPDQVARIRNKEIGFVYQFFNLIPTLSALENVELPLQIQGGLTRDSVREKALDALDAVGLSARLNHRPDQLSGGEQQRTAIARALVTEPAIILADEPTGNLDSGTGEDVMNYLADVIEKRDLTAVVVTHDAKIAARAERVLCMRDGRLVGESRPEPDFDEQELIKQLRR